jgi:hypothetical protein
MNQIKKYLSLALLLSLGMQGIYGAAATKVARDTNCTVSACDTASTCGEVKTIYTGMASQLQGQNLPWQYHKPLFACDASQSVDLEMAGREEDSCNWVAAFDLTYRYSQSRNPGGLSNLLFGGSQLNIAGADVDNRDSMDNTAIAEYFGLSPDTNTSVSFAPRLKNQVLDFQLQLSGEKLWFQINVPLAWAQWRVNSGCKAPAGTVGDAALDGASLTLTYVPNTTATTDLGSINVVSGDTTSVVNAPSGTGLTTVFFDNADSAGDQTSLMKGINGLDLTNVSSDTAISNQSVSLNGGTAAEAQVGTFMMGLYGDFNGGTENAGSYTGTFEVSEVAPAATLAEALNGYTFGNLAQRNYNNINFNVDSKMGLADLPMMLGYDFIKSDAYHFGVYAKFVIPTGTKIDSCYLQNVLMPIIGNGRHFELGAGASAHASLYSNDNAAFGVYADGYATHIFSASQIRSFDLQGQPLSRYALVYNLEADESGDLSNSRDLSAVGDVNVYNGDVNAAIRGEFMIEGIWSMRNFEFGAGYAFAGQSAEKMSNCNSSCTSSTGNASQYALVGNALQNVVGVGPVTPADATSKDALLTLTGTTAAAAVNFINLGSSDQVAQVAAGDNAIYDYGTPADIDEAALMMSSVEGTSGLMNAQILNRLFAHADYVMQNHDWQPQFGLIGSIGFVPSGYTTANYWELGARAGFVF